MVSQKNISSFPEPDRIAGALHPRDTARIFGQDKAEKTFLHAYMSNRLPHAWLFTGTKGIGKASFAWRVARFLITHPPMSEQATGEKSLLFADAPAPIPQSLDSPPDHPAMQRINALSEPRLFLLRRGANNAGTALSAEIRIDELRQMRNFFHLSTTEGGNRVVIIDAIDELNANAANALLKVLEEPPKNVIFLLISHQPYRLLPTIKSRCQTLVFAPLGEQDIYQALAQQPDMDITPNQAALIAELCHGSVGQALGMMHAGGLDLYAKLITLFQTSPISRPYALELAETYGQKGKETHFELLLTLIDLFLGRLAFYGATHSRKNQISKGEQALFDKLNHNPYAARSWAELAQTISHRVRRGRAVNLDPASLLMDSFLKIDEMVLINSRK